MKKTKHLITLCLAILMVACFGSAALAAPAQPIQITVDGHAIYTDVAPQIINNRTMVPIRTVSEVLAADVDFNNTTKEITISAPDGKIVKFKLGSKNAAITKDGKNTILTMDVTPQLKNNRTLVPIRFAAEALDAQVDYDAKTKTVPISTPALTVDGKAINTMTIHQHMLTGGATIGYYGNGNVAQAYKLLTSKIGAEVAKPDKYGEIYDRDTVDYYYMAGQFRFHNGEAKIDSNTGEPSSANPAVKNYEIYNIISDNPDAQPPAGYTAYLIRDLDTDQWYQYDQAAYDNFFDFVNKMNQGMVKELFNDVA